MSVRVPSLSDPTVVYTVTERNGVLRCDCPRAGFLKDHAEDKHVAIVRRANALLIRCADAHGLFDPPRLCRQCLVELLAASARRVRTDYVPKIEAKAKIAAARKKRTRKKTPKEKEAIA